MLLFCVALSIIVALSNIETAILLLLLEQKGTLTLLFLRATTIAFWVHQYYFHRLYIIGRTYNIKLVVWVLYQRIKRNGTGSFYREQGFQNFHSDYILKNHKVPTFLLSFLSFFYHSFFLDGGRKRERTKKHCCTKGYAL